MIYTFTRGGGDERVGGCFRARNVANWEEGGLQGKVGAKELPRAPQEMEIF